MSLLSAVNATVNATMRAVVWSGIPFNMTVQDVPMPVIQNQSDAVVRITTSAICGSDLHIYRGFTGGQPPYIIGHEAVGYVSEVGSAVSGLSVGQYVVIPDNIGHGQWEDGPRATDYAYGNGASLPDGLQAEYARVPYADTNLFPLPITANTTNQTIEQDYLTVSDIFATAWTGLSWSGFEAGDSVAVFGAGPVGLLVAYSAQLRGASNVYIVDHVQQRLDRAASFGIIPINFTASDPVQQILAHEPEGVMRTVDAVGMEAVNADLDIEQDIVVTNMISVLHRYGGMGQVGVWTVQPTGPGSPRGDVLSPNITFPITDMFAKGLKYQNGVVNTQLVTPELVHLIAAGRATPGRFIETVSVGIEEAPEYYGRFNRTEEIKVFIHFP